MNKLLSAGAAFALAFLALPSHAEEEMRPYLSAGYQHVISDDDLPTDDSKGGYFSVGKPVNEFLGLEINGFYTESNDNSAPVAGREFGAKLDGLFFFSRKAGFSPYFGLGVGMIRTDAFLNPTISSKDPFVDAGLGFIKYFAYNGGPDLGFQADVRYRWADREDLPSTPGFGIETEEPVFRVGLVIPLGPRATVAAAAAADASSRVAGGKITGNDADGDGVLDDADDCPGTPAGWLIDAKGCPIDSDHDGVPDNLDKCPGTAAGIAVDAKGCPLSAAATGAARSFENVNFAFDQSDLTDYAKALLDNAAGVIGGLTQKYPALKVDISGHTDWMGTDAYNQALSERRANAVKDYLQRKGVDASRISTFAYGESKPIAPNDTEEGRALNRRAEVRTRE